MAKAENRAREPKESTGLSDRIRGGWPTKTAVGSAIAEVGVGKSQRAPKLDERL